MPEAGIYFNKLQKSQQIFSLHISNSSHLIATPSLEHIAGERLLLVGGHWLKEKVVMFGLIIKLKCLGFDKENLISPAQRFGQSWIPGPGDC